MATRRSILAILSTAPAAAAIAAWGVSSALTGCAPKVDAASAWRAPGAGETDPRRFALAHAMLAPNPHNRQPWLARLIGDDQLELFFDTTKLLPATDPFSRQITIGGGTFLELLSLAALKAGFQTEITPFPRGSDPEKIDQRPFAHVFFRRGGVGDPLFEHILLRRTNREPFDTKRGISANDASAIAQAGSIGTAFGETITDQRVAALRTLTDKAYKVEVLSPAPFQESVDLMRIGAKEIEQHRDGLFLDGPMIELLSATGQLNRKALADPTSVAFKTGLSMQEPATRSAMGYFAIKTETNTRIDQINAGRAYARGNLVATARGISMHPLSQALQEYPQIAAEKAQMDRITKAPADGRLQMLARIGFAETVPPAPRRDWRAIIQA